MATEIRTRGMQQTHKVDVYSLGVTMLAIAGAGGFDEASIHTEQNISTAIEAGIRDPGFGSLASLVYRDPTARPSAQKVFLSIWHHDPEALQLPPKEAETPPATARNPVARPNRGKHTLQVGDAGSPAGVIKRRQRSTPIAQRVQNALRNNQRTPTTATVQLFSELLNESPRRRFTWRD
jgi:hypothetical protein